MLVAVVEARFEDSECESNFEKKVTKERSLREFCIACLFKAYLFKIVVE